MKKLTTVIFLFQISIALSQNISSKTKLEIDSLLNLSKEGLFKIDLVSTLNHSQIALQKSKKNNYSEGKARAGYYLANALFETGNYKNALQYLSNSLEEDFTKNTPQLVTDIYRVKGRAYANMGFEDVAISEFKNALIAAEQIQIIENRKYTQSLLYENLINLFQKKGLIDSVRYYLNQNKLTLKGLKEDFIFRNLSNYHNSMAEYFISTEKYDSAISSLSKSISISKKYANPYNSETYKIWGNIKLAEKQTDSALHYYFKSIQNINETGLENELPPIYESIASIYKSKGDSTLAKNYRLKCLEIRQRFTDEKKEANEIALKIILEEKSDQIKKKSYKLAIILAVAFFIFIILIILYFRRKQKKNYNRILTKRKLLTEKDEIIHQKEEETNQLKLRVNESFEEVLQLARENSPEFIVRFSEVYPEYYQKLLNVKPKLLKAEVRFCALLYLNFTTKDIAKYTFVTVKAVQHRKFRMRKKLNIPSDVDLTDWINNN